MTNKLSKILLNFKILCIISILVLDSTIAYAKDIEFPTYGEELESKAAFVMDADSSYVLYEKNADEKLYPASLTKVMTAIIVLERANGNYDDMVNFSYLSVTKDIDRTSVTIGASAGDQLSVKDCLYSLLLPSANDAANALAEYVAGSINDFALLMNEKAENLGCTNTHFVNPSGLHDDNQYTTASDMAKILQCAMSYPMFLQISSSVSYRHAPIRRYKNPENSNNQVLNTNSIMVPGSGYYYNGVTSGKTGHTKLAGYNLVASARKNKMNLICVLLGGSSEKVRYNEAKSLFDFYFSNYKSLNIGDADPRFSDSLDSISIDDVNLIDTLSITCSDNSHITLPNDAEFSHLKSDVSYTIEDQYDKYAIGTVYYYLGDKLVGKCSLDGKNIKDMDTIYTTHLNVSRVMNDSNEENVVEQAPINPANNRALIYKNANGNLVISSTLISLIIILVAIIFLIFISTFLYTTVFTNTNFPLHKILFRARRRLKR